MCSVVDGRSSNLHAHSRAPAALSRAPFKRQSCQTDPFGPNPLSAHFVISPMSNSAAGGAQSATGILMAAAVHTPLSRLEIVA